jgi:outer membrane receptor protein involved in Fe transport
MFMRGPIWVSLCLLLLWPASARGQLSADDEAEPDFTAEEVLDQVIVTGSRVRRSNLDSPSPVLVFEAAQLKATGISTLGEFARYLPQNANTFSDSSTGNNGFLGAAAFNLRGIGLDGTLTLVNGRRVAPYGGSGDVSPYVDINIIPVAAIERIEVLKDGASAIYGSEAVAGVVNIITRKQIDDIVAEGGYLTTLEGDGTETDANIAGGWSNEQTRFAATLSWFDRELIWSRDRDWSSNIDLSDRGGGDERSFASSPGWLILLDSELFRADPACPDQGPIASRYTEVDPDGTVYEFCRFNYAHFTTMQQPSTRRGGTASLEHDFHAGLEFFAELIYNRSETQSVLAPTPLAAYFVPAFHPQNPFGEDGLIIYRMLDAGDRGFDSTAITWRAIAGLNGTLNEWEWEAALMQSEAKSEDSRVNGVLRAAFQDALLGLGGPNGDQFYNPFGLNPQNPPEVLEQILISGTRTILTDTETTVDLQLNGSFGALPGGPIGAAFGLQWRNQELDQFADAEELSGVIDGDEGILPLIEDRKIRSAYVEFVLPLHRTLEVQLAARYDHYSDFGATTNPKVGLGWRPVEGLLVRATWGTSFRPPTFRELYDPEFEFEGRVFGDPLRCPVTDSFIDCDFHAVAGVTEGNPGLMPDEGETRLLGLAWEPQSVTGLALTLEYWWIGHQNRIVGSGFPGEDPFEFFLAELPPDSNPFVVRAPPTPEDIALGIPGVITATYSTFINADKVTTDGIDFEAAYNWFTRVGEFSATLNYTWLHEFVTGVDSYGVSYSENQAGGYGETSALPKNRGNLGLHWERNIHAVNAVVRYAGSYESPVNLYIDGLETDTPFVVDAFTQLDLQYSYTIVALREAVVRIGCQNCTGADPPVYNYDVIAEPFHEGRGALVYVRWTQPF